MTSDQRIKAEMDKKKDKDQNWLEQTLEHRRFHGRLRHLGSGANAAKFTVNVWGKS